MSCSFTVQVVEVSRRQTPCVSVAGLLEPLGSRVGGRDLMGYDKEYGTWLCLRMWIASNCYIHSSIKLGAKTYFQANKNIPSLTSGL